MRERVAAVVASLGLSVLLLHVCRQASARGLLDISAALTVQPDSRTLPQPLNATATADATLALGAPQNPYFVLPIPMWFVCGPVVLSCGSGKFL